MSVFAPARLQLVKALPTGKVWLYEPKVDGYRGLVAKDATGRVSVESRNGKDLGGWFPELLQLAKELPAGTLIDGEIVSPTASGVSFMALQWRLTSPRAELSEVAIVAPAALVAFDLLLHHGRDLRALRLSERRPRLDRLIRSVGVEMLQLVTQTGDPDEAAAWPDDSMSMAGIEGVVAKRDEAYPKPTVRKWQKIRRVSTIDVYVEGFMGDPPRLVIGLPHDGEIRIVGTTRPLRPDELTSLAGRIQGAVPGDRSMFTYFGSGRVDEWFRIPRGLIAEVAVSGIDGGTLRQPVRFVRWRT